MIQCTDVFLRPIGTAQIPSSNYKSWCVYVILRTGAFMWDYTPVHLYDLWAPHTNTNYKSWCICAIMSTSAFMWDYAPVHLYDLLALHKYQYELEQSVCLFDTMKWCIYLSPHTSALRWPMGSAKIPRPIRMAPCIVSQTLHPVQF